jgi:catechol 2,3-dioxygenase-like lactoylglutathione lyase family enzyme
VPTTAATHITEAATAIIPVTDQDRAVDFYAEVLGFPKRADFEYGDGVRWVEVAHPRATTGLAFAVAPDTVGVETRLAFSSQDVEADHAALLARGVDVGPILRPGDPVVHWGGAVLAGTPPMFLVRDPDGNSILIVAAP